MGTTAGIGIGIAIGIALTLSFVVFLGTDLGTSTLEDIPALVFNEPRLASLESWYDDDTGKLQVALMLTDKNAEYTKADGNLELLVAKDGREVYSTEYDFKKDDFLAWKNSLTGEKITGYRMTINQNFYDGSHDVYINMQTDSGLYWEDLHTSFWALRQ